MNHATRTAAQQSTQQSAAAPARLPRRQRLGSAVASVIVTSVLFGSVVLGMTSTSDDGRQLIAQAHAVAHT